MNVTLWVVYITVLISSLLIPFYKTTVIKGQMEYIIFLSGLENMLGSLISGSLLLFIVMSLLHIGIPTGIFLFIRKRLKNSLSINNP